MPRVSGSIYCGAEQSFREDWQSRRKANEIQNMSVLFWCCCCHTTGSSSEQNRIVFYFVWRSIMSLYNFWSMISSPYLTWCPAHLLPWKTSRIIHWIKPRDPSAKQKDWWKSQFSVCFLTKMPTRVSMYFGNHCYSNPWLRAHYTCSCWILGISAFLIACAQRENNISYEDHGIFCIYWNELVISFAISYSK